MYGATTDVERGSVGFSVLLFTIVLRYSSQALNVQLKNLKATSLLYRCGPADQSTDSLAKSKRRLHWPAKRRP